MSLQVSTAVRLCDGALVVVDVVEGVCPQVRFLANLEKCSALCVKKDLYLLPTYFIPCMQVCSKWEGCCHLCIYW